MLKSYTAMSLTLCACTVAPSQSRINLFTGYDLNAFVMMKVIKRYPANILLSF